MNRYAAEDLWILKTSVKRVFQGAACPAPAAELIPDEVWMQCCAEVCLFVIVDYTDNDNIECRRTSNERAWGGLFVIAQDGVTFVGWPTDSLLKVCLTPDPDALAGVGRSVAVGATGAASAAAAAAGTTSGTPAPAGQSASVSGSASFNVANLGGRTQMVLLERDLLYRACEMSNNLQLTKAETLKVYASIIDKVIDLARLLGPNPGSAAATPTNFSSNANPSADLASNAAANLSSPPGSATPGTSPSATSNAAGQPPPPPPPPPSQ